MADPEPVCFDSLILAQSWWVYAVVVALWLLLMALFLLLEARWQIRGYFWRPWRWELTGRQWRKVTVAGVLFAAACVGVAYGLFYYQQVHRRDTYAGALSDWVRHLATGQEPENARLAELVRKVGKEERAKAFVDIGRAICHGFPKLSAADELSRDEIIQFGPALSYWMGPAPKDVVVQGNKNPDRMPEEYRNWGTTRLPKAGVPRQDWPGGETRLKWSSTKKLGFLKPIIEMSKIVRGQGFGSPAVPSSKVLHPVELKPRQLEDVRAYMSQCYEALATEAAVKPDSIKSSECAEFWYIYARIVGRYFEKEAASAEDRRRWTWVHRYVVEQAGEEPDWAGNGWIYGQLKLLVNELNFREEWIEEGHEPKPSGFSPREIEVNPLLCRVEDKDRPTKVRPGVEDSRTMLRTFEFDNPPWPGSGPVDPRELAAVCLAEHIYVGYQLADFLPPSSRSPNDREKAVIRELYEKLPQSETAASGQEVREWKLWDTLFANNSIQVQKLYDIWLRGSRP